MRTWDISMGEVTTRTKVSIDYGGARFGGIQPSGQTPNVLIYSDPTSGAQHGYEFDGWDPYDASVFYYTGEGQVGDQQLTKGNKSILEHAEDGRSLRLFEAVGGLQRGGKPQRYVGKFELDAEDPFRFERAPDRTGASRKVIVFKLRAVDGPSARKFSSAHETAPPLAPQLVAVEANIVDHFSYAGIEEAEALRMEADLMRRFESYLRDLGSQVARFEIPLRQSGRRLLTDTFDITENTLWEVKGAADRQSVRMAIGQLADYRRYLPPDIRSGIVLPADFSDDQDDLYELIELSGHFLTVGRGDLMGFDPIF
ncbi:restriction endonuclease [Janibacter melonis]|uniref:restriction endonuclease n=1 Tax=Janibacter melonis TaxID=262209 RepID=UPI00174BE3A4|nr:restriction endonuclease [Janibacter melonis]